MTTYKEKCEKLSERLKAHGVEKTPGQIWAMDPHGEIWVIHDLEERLDNIDYAMEANDPKATPEFIKSYLENIFKERNTAARL